MFNDDGTSNENTSSNQSSSSNKSNTSKQNSTNENSTNNQNNINSSSQKQESNYIEGQRNMFGQSLKDSLATENSGLNAQNKEIDKMRNEADIRRAGAVSELGRQTSYLSISPVSADEVAIGTVRYRRLNRSVVDSKEQLNPNEDHDSVNYEYLSRAQKELTVNEHRATIKACLQDDWVNAEERAALNSLDEEFKEAKKEDKRLSEHKVEVIKSLVANRQLKNKLESEYPVSKKGSLIDDFADVSTEMPSYMDPDDG